MKVTWFPALGKSFVFNVYVNGEWIGIVYKNGDKFLQYQPAIVDPIKTKFDSIEDFAGEIWGKLFLHAI